MGSPFTLGVVFVIIVASAIFTLGYVPAFELILRGSSSSSGSSSKEGGGSSGVASWGMHFMNGVVVMGILGARLAPP